MELPAPPPIPAIEPAIAPPEAEALPRAGDDGMRVGYNEVLTAGSNKLPLFTGSGTDTARVPMNWRIIQPQGPEAFAWDTYDAVYTQLLEQGIRPLWAVIDAPCWAGDVRVPCEPTANSAGAPGPEHATDLGTLVAAIAERYPESLGIEIGNEVNDPRFWPNGQNPVGYVDLLAQAAAAIDEVDPDMPIVAAGLAPISRAREGKLTWRTYLNVMLANGAADYVDAFAFHPYVRTAPDEDPGPAVAALVGKVEASMAARGAGDVPLWITEFGVTTASNPPRTPEQQAYGLVSILMQLEARGTQVAIVHRLVDEVRVDFPLEAGFGVVGVDHVTRKPSYCAIAGFRGVPCA